MFSFFVFLFYCLFIFLSFWLFVFLSFYLFIVLFFLSFFVFLSCCLFVMLSFCLFVLLYFCPDMSEGCQVSKVTLCVKVLKWRLPSQSVTKVRYRAARAAKNCPHDISARKNWRKTQNLHCDEKCWCWSITQTVSRKSPMPFLPVNGRISQTEKCHSKALAQKCSITPDVFFSNFEEIHLKDWWLGVVLKRKMNWWCRVGKGRQREVKCFLSTWKTALLCHYCL